MERSHACIPAWGNEQKNIEKIDTLLKEFNFRTFTYPELDSYVTAIIHLVLSVSTMQIRVEQREIYLISPHEWETKIVPVSPMRITPFELGRERSNKHKYIVIKKELLEAINTQELNI